MDLEDLITLPGWYPDNNNNIGNLSFRIPKITGIFIIFLGICINKSLNLINIIIYFHSYKLFHIYFYYHSLINAIIFVMEELGRNNMSVGASHNKYQKLCFSFMLAPLYPLLLSFIIVFIRIEGFMHT